MFDVRTSALLKAAPSLSTLNAEELPSILTRHYAELVSARLKSVDNTMGSSFDAQWSLERIADVYETITSIEEDAMLRRGAAFVAGTARLIISRSRKQISGDDDDRYYPIDRDSVDSSTAAAVLFLAAEQYADAFEAVSFIPRPTGPYEVTILGEHIKDLASGKHYEILKRAKIWRDSSEKGLLQDRALRSLAAVLVEGIEILASNMMSVPIPSSVSG